METIRALWGFFSSKRESFQLSSSFDRVPCASAWIEMLMGIHVSLYHSRNEEIQRKLHCDHSSLSQSDFNVCWGIRWLHELAVLLELTFDVDVRWRWRWKNGVVLYLSWMHFCSLVESVDATRNAVTNKLLCFVEDSKIAGSPVERITYNCTGWPG